MQNDKIENIEAPILKKPKVLGYIALNEKGERITNRIYKKAATAKGIQTKDAKAKAKAEAKKMEERILNLFKR